MFERFTDRARESLVLAQSEAKEMRHAFIGTEHVVLGLLAEGEGVAAIALGELGVTLDDVRRVAAGLVPAALGELPEKPPFTPRAKKVLEHSLRAALDLRHNHIGTEHLLLGVARQADGVGNQVLATLGAAPAAVEQKVREVLDRESSSSDGGGAAGPETD